MKAGRRSDGGAGNIGSSRSVSSLLIICVAMFTVGFFLGTLKSERDTLRPQQQAGQSQGQGQGQEDMAALSERVFAQASSSSSSSAGSSSQSHHSSGSGGVSQHQAATGSHGSRAGTGPTTCENTCSQANNGICEDGTGFGKGHRNVSCDLGTDCADCGPFVGVLPGGTWKEGGPMRHLVSKEVPIFTRMTATTPPFQVMYTDPTKDLDVSEMLDRTGLLESGITSIFRMVLEHRCVDQATGQRRLVLDVGANFGYFTVYAAMMGCRVIAWEPIPHFRAVLEWAVAANNMSHLVTVRGHAVTNIDHEEITMQAPTKGVWGTASVGGISQFKSQAPSPFTVTSERVDSVVDEDVVLMKVDVEGFESVVFKSAERLLSQREVEHIVLEYNPGVAELVAERQDNYHHLLEDNPAMLLSLLQKDYKIGMMHDHIAKGGVFADGQFPALPQVLASRMRHDMEDAAVLRRVLPLIATRGWVADQGLNCPIKHELGALNYLWNSCTRCPDDLHPKSLRSAFPYNTNLWAAKGGRLITFAGVAGAMGPEQDASKEWFVNAKEPDPFAMASRSCKYLPARELVRNRCSCDWSVKQEHSSEAMEACRAEERMVLKLMREGRFNFTDYEFQGGTTSQQ